MTLFGSEGRSGTGGIIRRSTADDTPPTKPGDTMLVEVIGGLYPTPGQGWHVTTEHGHEPLKI